MINKIKEFFVKNEYLLIFIFVLLFIAIRFPGTSLPLHQDEYKWPIIVNPENHGQTSIPHPPLSQFIYKTAGYIVGFNVNFRFVPLFFGILNLILLYSLMKSIFGKKEAIIASFIWIFSYFSVLASLMVDTDGQILPFFFLLLLFSYYKLRQSEGDTRHLWAGLLIISAICGFFVKVSFTLAICAVLADFLWSKKHLLTKLDILRYIVRILISTVILVVILFLSQKLFPFFNLSNSLEYWKHFWVVDRGWFQTAIQCVKALFYTSPLLVLTPLFFKDEKYSKIRSLIFFLIFSFIFYIVLFDFSIGALDRYLQLLILPLTILSSICISSIIDLSDHNQKKFLFYGFLVSFILILIQFFPHYVPSLHPKSEWIGRVLSFKWNFVYPFTGGSGPLGFYVSFLFICLSWFVSFFAFLFSKFKPDYKKLMLIFIIPIGFFYNLVFIEEYLFGYWNGNAPKLLNNAIEFIKNDKDIKMVTTYNDNGGNELQEIGKYRKRLYVDPKFDVNEKIKTLNQYKEHYFVLDVPQIDPESIYRRYFNSCTPVYTEYSKKMSATVYDCRKVSDIKIP